MRVVGSLTTIPSRIKTIEPILQSIANQSYKLDALYIGIPFTSASENQKYPIPDFITNYCGIVRCQDYGPVTKLVAALLTEQDPKTVIITFDDNKIYPEGLVEKLVSKHVSNPKAAIGSSGLKIGGMPFYISTVFNEYHLNNRWFNFKIDTAGEYVDVLFDKPGVLYVRKFFPDVDNIYKLIKYTVDETLFKNSDIVISGYLSKRNIERLVFKMPTVETKSTYNWRKIISQSKAIYIARKRELFKNRMSYSKSKTITYPIVLGLILILVCSIIVFVQ